VPEPRGPQPGDVAVVADLDFTVDLGSGPIQGRVEGHGRILRVTTEDADAVWQAASSVPEVGTSWLPAFADRLTDAGLSLEVVGPQGRVATVGYGASSFVGRLVTGSRAVQPGDGRAVFALLLAQARRNPRTLLGVGAGVGIVAALAVVLRRRG
jgi:hypothetical protein